MEGLVERGRAALLAGKVSGATILGLEQKPLRPLTASELWLFSGVSFKFHAANFRSRGCIVPLVQPA